MPPNATAGGQSITDSLISAAATAAAESEQNPTKLQQDSTGVLFECDAETIDGGLVKDIVSMKKADRRKLKLVWRNIILFGYLHLAALYGAWLIFTSAKWQTIALGKWTDTHTAHSTQIASITSIINIFPCLFIADIFPSRAAHYNCEVIGVLFISNLALITLGKVLSQSASPDSKLA